MVGNSETLARGIGWLREAGVEVVELHDGARLRLLADFIRDNPALWAEDIGDSDGSG